MVDVWEVATGQEIANVPTGRVDQLALAPDGRTLITTDAIGIRLWDLETATERHRIAFPEDLVFASRFEFMQTLAIAPDGRHATTGLGDGTLLVWKLPPFSPEPQPIRDVSPLWNDLGNADAAKAYAAIWKLRRSPESAVAFLSQHLTPSAHLGIDRLLKDLDSNSFSIRRSATRELAKLGNAVVPALYEALAAKPSPEVRRRVEQLLVDCSRNRSLPPEQLRRLRAIQVLERIGSAEARHVLERLAQADTYSLETQDAKASLRRLSK
jgi:hypothetical protein